MAVFNDSAGAFVAGCSRRYRLCREYRRCLVRHRPQELLGVDHTGVNFDFYATFPTELGRSWGLDRGWVSSYAVGRSDAIQVLGIDENGRAGAWVKSFGGPAGTGFVGMGSDYTTPDGLRAIRAVAEFGFE